MIHPGQRKHEGAGHDSDNRVGLAIERHFATDDVGISAKLALPQSVAQDGHQMPGLILLSREGTSETGLHAEAAGRWWRLRD